MGSNERKRFNLIQNRFQTIEYKRHIRDETIRWRELGRGLLSEALSVERSTGDQLFVLLDKIGVHFTQWISKSWWLERVEYVV
jgi:hypothetical protein